MKNILADVKADAKQEMKKHVQKKVALRDSKNRKITVFVLFENEASYEDFFALSVLSHVTDTL